MLKSWFPEVMSLEKGVDFDDNSQHSILIWMKEVQDLSFKFMVSDMPLLFQIPM